MAGRWWSATIAVATLLCAVQAGAQSHRALNWDKDKRPEIIPEVELPDPDQKAWMECEEFPDGSVDCLMVRPPIKGVIDSNGDTLPDDPFITVIQALLPLVISQQDDGVLGIGVDPAWRIIYSALELDAMGACTNSQPCTIDTIWTLGAAGQLRHVGGQRASLVNTLFVDCSSLAYSTGGTKGYCAIRGGPALATTTAAEAELIWPHDCIVKEINVSTWTTATAYETVPATCTLSFGLRIAGSDTAALCTVGTGLHQAAANCTPSASWTKGQTVATWFSTAGGGCGTANHRPGAIITCY